jgi:hypothetical protein
LVFQFSEPYFEGGVLLREDDDCLRELLFVFVLLLEDFCNFVGLVFQQIQVFLQKTLFFGVFCERTLHLGDLASVCGLGFGLVFVEERGELLLLAGFIFQGFLEFGDLASTVLCVSV